MNGLQAGQGSRLGLYIAKGIAEQHESSLIVLSEGARQGNTISLPLHIAPDSVLPRNAEEIKNV
jgi:signal transduction histidine kinase